jgi:hypothetical protein
MPQMNTNLPCESAKRIRTTATTSGGETVAGQLRTIVAKEQVQARHRPFKEARLCMVEFQKQ